MPPVEPLNQGDREGAGRQFEPDLRRPDSAQSGEPECGDFDPFDWSLVVRGCELGQPERFAVLHIGLGPRTARATSAGQGLQVRSRDVFALFIGPGYGGDCLQVHQSGNGSGRPPDDLALVIEKAERALAASVVGEGKVFELREACAIGALKETAAPGVGRGIRKNTRQGVAHMSGLACRMNRASIQRHVRLQGKAASTFDPGLAIGEG